jgi:hypothetical protein
MRRFSKKKVNALDSKGKSISGTIKPVHTDFWLDLPEEEREGKLHLFALARRGQALEQAKTLRLVVEPSTADRRTSTVRVNVLYAHTFGLEDVSNGDYWDDVPESLRFDIQDMLADALMDRAKPENIGLFNPLQRERERFPYRGAVFSVSGLEGLEALFQEERG